jgi:hypothetical protein
LVAVAFGCGEQTDRYMDEAEHARIAEPVGARAGIGDVDSGGIRVATCTRTSRTCAKDLDALLGRQAAITMPRPEKRAAGYGGDSRSA